MKIGGRMGIETKEVIDIERDVFRDIDVAVSEFLAGL